MRKNKLAIFSVILFCLVVGTTFCCGENMVADAQGSYVFENGDFGFYHTHLCDCHSAQAEYYAKKGNAEETIRHLDKAAEHAIKFVTEFDEEATHTSLVFRGHEYGIFSTGSTSNDALELLEKMERPCYDFVREIEAFCGIQESLKIHAQKWQVKE